MTDIPELKDEQLRSYDVAVRAGLKIDWLLAPLLD